MQEMINPAVTETDRENLRSTVMGGAAIKLEPLRTVTTPLPTKPNTADPFPLEENTLAQINGDEFN
jgi:hypothetical protein